MASETRSRLLSAAELLFAEHGVEGVSLREINRSAEARNVYAVQYHFEDRDGVLLAILDKHMPGVDQQRHALLDEIEEGGELSARAMAGALVRPLTTKLSDRDGGRAFLQIYADLLNRPTPALKIADGRFSSLRRWSEIATPLVDPAAVPLHPRLSALLYTVVELARRAKSGTRSDEGLFSSRLVDVVANIFTAPVSDETRQLSIERNARRKH